MIRRILAGAAIAGVAFALSASGASADDGPNAANSGNQLLSQYSILNNATVLNNVLNGSANYIDVLTIEHLADLNVAALNNNNG
ncbi:hypothetical protein ABT294_09980 [Nonomuraea sp. NPDC000554]|uniref:hypothetical protein n=1 Tax=Nonomuraea sp. NPDC000554 TaxID=3154259 RepID=UPI00332FE603